MGQDRSLFERKLRSLCPEGKRQAATGLFKFPIFILQIIVIIREMNQTRISSKLAQQRRYRRADQQQHLLDGGNTLGEILDTILSECRRFVYVGGFECV